MNNEKISLPIQSKTTLNKKFEKIPTAPDINITEKIIEKENLINLDKKTLDDVQTSDEKFREINFSYPQWKPDQVKSIKNEKNDIKNKYQELGDNSRKNFLKLDA